MPISAYSGLSSTISSDEPQAPATSDERKPEALATSVQGLQASLRETGDHAVNELADFDRMVDVVLREHSEVEEQRNRLLMQSALAVFAIVGTVGIIGIIGIIALPTTFSAVEKNYIAVAAVLVGIAPSYWLGNLYFAVRKRRRTCEELAEIVREAAPLFMPKMSMIRRAEIKIRLSNIGIYDPLKYR